MRILLRRPSTHSFAPASSLPFCSSHSPSLSAYLSHDHSQRAMRWVVGLRLRAPGIGSKGSRPSMIAYSKTPSAHASVIRPSYSWPMRSSGAA